MDVELERSALDELRDRSRQAFEPVADERGLDAGDQRSRAGAARSITTDGGACSRCSRTCSPTRASSPSTARSRCASAQPRTARTFTSEHLRERRGRRRVLGDATPASASPRTSCGSSSRRSSRPRAASSRATAARAWACRSAARSRACSAARSTCESTPDEGSTFTLYLPRTWSPPEAERDVTLDVHGVVHAGELARSAAMRCSRSRARARRPARARGAGGVADDLLAQRARRRSRPDPAGRSRAARRRGRRGLRAHGHGLRARAGLTGVVATTRGDVGWALAHEYRPDAIVLDIQLPGASGWSVLDRLKHHPATRHIPVHVVVRSTSATTRCARAPLAFLEKPVSSQTGSTDAFADVGASLARRHAPACSSSRTTRSSARASSS